MGREASSPGALTVASWANCSASATSPPLADGVWANLRRLTAVLAASAPASSPPGARMAAKCRTGLTDSLPAVTSWLLEPSCAEKEIRASTAVIHGTVCGASDGDGQQEIGQDCRRMTRRAIWRTRCSARPPAWARSFMACSWAWRRKDGVSGADDRPRPCRIWARSA